MTRLPPVLVGAGVLSKAGTLLKHSAKVAVVADPEVPARHRGRLLASLRRSRIPFFVLETPPSKRLASLERLARASARAGLGRDGAVVAFGGGRTGDLAGLLAALYLRGIPVLQVPTTLLAQADAAVGGKTAVDLPEGRNLLGAFHQPLAVLCDTTLLAPDSIEGWAEIVKCALLDGEKSLRALENGADAASAVRMALRVKMWIVERDERETKGLRERLNLGHTLAHAAEAASAFRLGHGRAVAAGLIAACEVSRRLGVLEDPALGGRVEALLGRLGLPARFPTGLSRDRILQAARRDKKARNGRIRMVLPVRPGRVVVRAVPLPVLRAVL